MDGPRVCIDCGNPARPGGKTCDGCLRDRLELVKPKFKGRPLTPEELERIAVEQDRRLA